MKQKNAEKTLSEEGKLIAAQKRADAKKLALEEELKRFSSLPDEAHVRLPVVMALYACSAASAWRYVKNGTLPAPRKFGSRVTAWNVGQLRAALNA